MVILTTEDPGRDVVVRAGREFPATEYGNRCLPGICLLRVVRGDRSIGRMNRPQLPVAKPLPQPQCRERDDENTAQGHMRSFSAHTSHGDRKLSRTWIALPRESRRITVTVLQPSRVTSQECDGSVLGNLSEWVDLDPPKLTRPLPRPRAVRAVADPYTGVRADMIIEVTCGIPGC